MIPAGGHGWESCVGCRAPVGRWQVTPMTSLPAKVLIAPIRFYQRFITPYTPAT